MTTNTLSTSALGHSARTSSTRWGGLSTKLIVAFTLVFTLVFSAAYFWFLSFSVQVAKDSVLADLAGMLHGLAAGINGDDFEGLIAEGQPRDDGYTDDERYWTIARHLANTKTYELGRTGIYTFTYGDDPTTQVRYVASAGSLLTPPVGVRFLQQGTQGVPLNANSTSPLQIADNIRVLNNQCWISSGAIPQAVLSTLGDNCISVDVGPDGGFFGVLTTPFGYQDEFGSWITGNFPIRNSDGEIVGGVSMDYYAPYVNQVRDAILSSAGIAFAVTYVVLFALVFLLSRTLTSPLRRLADAAALIGEGKYTEGEAIAAKLAPQDGRGWRDEITLLSVRLLDMAEKIGIRETKLKAEVEQLRIEIDQSRVQKQVAEVVESDFFEHLSVRVRELRERKDVAETEPPAST